MVYCNYKGENDMKFLESLVDAKSAELKDSNGKINQTDRNALRNTLLDALRYDLNAVMTADGAVIEFEHEYWGSLCVEVSLKMKDPEYDIVEAEEEYIHKQEAAELKKALAQKRSDERSSKAEALKSVKRAAK